MRIRLTLSLAMLSMSSPLLAQNTCGWSDAAPAGELPPNVAAIAKQLPTTWPEAPAVIANLQKWYHECDGGAARQALWDLRRAAERNRNDLAIAALYGSALMHGPEVQIEGATGITNRATFHLSNSERDGARLLARASADARFPMAAIELANVALATRHEPTVKIARDALRSVPAAAATARHASLAAELALVAADYPGAVQAGAQAVALGNTGAYHAIGIAHAMTSTDTVAARVYLQGLADTSALDLYYDDISYLLQPSDTLAWNALPHAERGEWLRKQWEWRASTSSLSVAERLKVHFTRLTQAWDLYPRTVFQSGLQMNAVVFDRRLRRMTLDDRGLIYIRHGAPVEIVSMRRGSLDMTRIAWAYAGLGNGRAIFEFTKIDCTGIEAPIKTPPAQVPSAGGVRAPPSRRSNVVEKPTAASVSNCVSSGDYYLATPIPCQDISADAAQATYFDYGTSLGRYDPGYATQRINCYNMAMSGSANEFIGLADLELKGESITRGSTALRTETAAPQLTSPIHALMHTYAMRAASATRLFAFTALDGGSVKPRAGTSSYALRLLLAVENHSRLSTENVDTTLAFATQTPMQAGQLARSNIATNASPAEEATIRFTVRNQNDAAQGQIITTTRAVPDFTGNRFALSDLVIAEDRDGPWSRGGVRLAPSPGHYVAQGATFRLYHEVYGAQEGDSLDVKITIAPGKGDNVMSQIAALVARRSAVQVAFAERAALDATGTARVLREVGADLEPGRYVVSVTVHNSRTNTSAEATTDLVILKP